jgi:hypothetical protein
MLIAWVSPRECAGRAIALSVKVYLRLLSMKLFTNKASEHWTKQKRLGNDINSPLYVSEEDIILTFKGEHTRAVDIVIPSDITASILKTRMAGLLSCDPAELVLQGNGIELKDSHMFGLGLFLGTNTVIHCRRFEAVAMDCDMMDDVQYIKEEPKYYENSHRKRPRHN